MSHPINLAEFEALARENLTPMAYDYYASGAHDELTLKENRAAYDRLALSYRVLRDVSERDLTTNILGQSISYPLLVSPTAFHGLATEQAELATAKAVAKAKTIMILSTLSNTDIEDVAVASEGRLWFQLYIYKDRGATKALIQRAEAAGCKAIVLTVDAPLWGCREKDVRNGFTLPEHLSIKNMVSEGKGNFPKEASGSGLAAYVTSMFDPSLTWKDVDWLCENTKLPVVIKGLVNPDDARLAVKSGVSGLIVSNHGGRQLDTSPATISALPEVVEAVAAEGGKLEVMVDGGVRRGTDVVKALALGATAVGIGRPVLWALAADGEAGVSKVLEVMRTEIDLAMGLCGFASISDIESGICRKF